MYWAVRTVKMKACRDCTKISRPKIAMLKIKATTPAVLLMIDSRVQQQVLPAQHEHQNQQVAGEHVGEESQGQGDRPDDDVGNELQRDDQRPHEHRHARRAAWCS